MDKFVKVLKINKKGLKGSLLGSFFLNLLITGSLSKLLGFITSLQLILHLPLMAIPIPPNVITMFEILIPVVMFDVLEGIDFFENLFDSDEEADVLDQMKQIGYETSNTIKNLGTLYVLMLVYFLKLFAIAILFIISKHTSKYEKWMHILIS